MSVSDLDTGHDASLTSRDAVTATSSGADEPRKVLRERLGFVLDASAKLVLIATFVIAYMEYSSVVGARQVTASFDLVKNWENDGYQKAYQRIGGRIDDLKADFASQFPLDANDPIALRDFVSGHFIDLMETDPTLNNDVTRVFYFFGKAGLCTIENICDERVLTRFFSDSAASFIYFFLPYARLERADGKPKFGIYAEEFAALK